MTGIPVEVPVPNRVTRTGSAFGIRGDLNVDRGSPGIFKGSSDGRLEIDGIHRKVAQRTRQHGQMGFRGLILVQHHQGLVIANADTPSETAFFSPYRDPQFTDRLFQLFYYLLNLHVGKGKTTS